MRIILGSDHRGLEIRNRLGEYLKERAGDSFVLVNGFGKESVDYPDIAAQVAEKISEGEADFGILICGTGIGMCVVANKFPGVRAAPCHNEVAAELARKHNDSNILCLSGDMLGERSTLAIVEKWLTTPFAGGYHSDRLEKIRELENRNFSFGSDNDEDSSVDCREPEMSCT